MNPESWTKNFRGFIMRKRHGVKVREEAVRRCLAGKSVKLVSKELGIKDHYIYEWVEWYKMYGKEGLEKQPYHEWSFNTLLSYPMNWICLIVPGMKMWIT